MPEPNQADQSAQKLDFSHIQGWSPVEEKELQARTLGQAKADLPKIKFPDVTNPEETERFYADAPTPPTSKLGKAYAAAKDWMGEHEQHLSEKYLAPFRDGLDRMADDLQEAGESGHTKSGGRLTGPTRALLSGAGELLKQVPVGRNVRETTQALITPPEFGTEGKALSKELAVARKDFSHIPGHSEFRSAARELPPQPKLADTGTHAAIKTDDGSIYFDDAPEKQRTHITLAKDLGIPPERIVSGGWLQDGHYEASERSDAGRWGEQARAKQRVDAKRVARSQTEQAETLYHGSPDISQIEELKPGKNGGYFGDGVYLSRDPEVARRFTKLESMNPTLERNADGSFTDINTGKRVPGGKPGVLTVNLKNARLKHFTIDEMDAETEKFRKPNGAIDLDAARNAVAEKYAKQGYDGFDVAASKHFDEPQVVIFPGSAKKLSVNRPQKTSSILTLEGAQPLADKLGAKVVGSVATGKTSPDPYGINRGPKDLDLRIDGEYKPDAINTKLKAEGFEPSGSSVVSPKEQKASGKNYGSPGWKRVEHFENAEGQKIDVWHDEPEAKPQKSLADQLFDEALAKLGPEKSKTAPKSLGEKQGGHAGGGVASVEELARPGRFVKISKSGLPTDQGKTPDFNLKVGEAGYQVLPDGTWKLQAGQESPTTKAGVQNWAREVYGKK